MSAQSQSFKDDYTCTVSGNHYEYDVLYTPGNMTLWRANIYRDGVLKSSPSGELVDHEMDDEGLKQYLMEYVEAIIEREESELSD